MSRKLTVSVQVRDDEMGGIRLGNTRIPVEWVIIEFLHGETPEQIVANFSSLTLADVYTIISYYLHNRKEIDAYIQRRDEEAAAIRREIEAKYPTTDLRQRLQARLSEEQRQYITSPFARTSKNGVDIELALHTIKLDAARLGLALDLDDQGILWVKDANLWFDVILYAYYEGQSPEDMVDSYPSLNLGNLYSLIGYYLKNRTIVDTYMRHREVTTPQLRQVVATQFPPIGRQARVLARRTA